MGDSNFKQLESLFKRANQLGPDAKEQFLADVRRESPGLAEELASLLEVSQDDRSLSGAVDSAAASAIATSEVDPIQPGTRVGNIEIVRRIGAGGMGNVYLGQQQEPFNRPVAVKLVRVGLQVDDLLARFDAERQVLARMNHPSIAQVFDAGVLDNGQPYVVMEYIDGEPLDQYFESKQPSLESRLDLFARVCDGVQHAHQRGVIHRDLKPSNVLVDGSGRPKIIDFGIAKLIEPNEDPKLTQMDQTVGTPQYMSPEQAGFKHDEVDTRSDVYALGVLLFEMLTGTPPQDVSGKSPLEVRQLILESDPPLASLQVLSSIPYSATTIRGDLDWIVAKAMARDKDRRYGSPAELAADLSRYRTNLPVSAGPDELLYRMRKFIRRHRAGVAVAAVAVVTIVLGLAGTSVGLLRALEAERAAAESADVANGTLQVIEDVFAAADPSQSRGEEITAKAVLDQGVEQIRANEQLPFNTRARLLQTMGSVYEGLSLYDSAQPLYEQAISLYESNANTTDDPPTWYYDARLGLGSVLRELGETDKRFEIIDALLKEQLERYGPNDARLVDTRLAVQSSYSGAGDETAALEHFKLAQDLFDRVGAPKEKHAFLMATLALMYVNLYKYDEAIEVGREAVAVVSSALGPDHPETVVARANLAWYLQLGRRHIEAENEFNAVIDDYERIFGENHFSLGTAIYNLGSLQSETGRYADAMANYTRARDIWRSQVGPTHPYVLVAFSDIAQMHYLVGEHEKSEAAYLELVAIEKESLDADDPYRAYALNNLGMVYHAIGQLDKAETYLTEAQDLRLRALGDSHEFVLDGHINLGRLAKEQGDIEAAKQRFRTVIDVGTERFNPKHSIVGRSYRELGKLLIEQGQANDALPLLTNAIESFATEYQEGYWETAVARSLYGEALFLSGDSSAAEAFLREGLDALLASEDRTSRHTQSAIERLIRFYEHEGDTDKQIEAQELLETIKAEAEQQQT
ncbi:MAG: serine/threonine-protein kinase [Pseudomonadota bacterium]